MAWLDRVTMDATIDTHERAREPRHALELRLKMVLQIFTNLFRILYGTVLSLATPDILQESFKSRIPHILRKRLLLLLLFTITVQLQD